MSKKLSRRSSRRERYCNEHDAIESGAVLADVVLATELFAIAPHALGGIALRSGPSPLRSDVVARVRANLSPKAAFLRVPLHITEDRLIGGLSLAATLETGRVVIESGLLVQANGGVVVTSMAERLAPNVTTHLCAAIDNGVISIERDGISSGAKCEIGVIALDEGIDDERAPDALRDRLSFRIDLNGFEPRVQLARSDAEDADARVRVEEARSHFAQVQIDDEMIVALGGAAAALGASSVRAPILAALVARAHAALAGRMVVNEDDVKVAARLVLGPRATRAPELVAEEENEPSSEPEDRDSEESRDRSEEQRASDERDEKNERPSAPESKLEEVVLASARSGIPAGLLDAIVLGRQTSGSNKAGHAGAARASSQGGRPAGTRAKAPANGERLNIVETLRAAAPWQRIRRRNSNAQTRVQVRKEDFRVTRFVQRAESSVIFSVDASGSAALQRLAEAKGAVEQVLADCYVRRDHVALVAFRGTTSTLLLPPTRSLARARRCLAELAGGGATPLAAGIDAAAMLALDAKKSGRTPIVVLMTDGRANISRDGCEGAAAAMVDALESARLLRARGVRSLFLDTSPRPRPQARLIAAEMGARYLPLPYLDAVSISRHVQALAGDAP